MKYELQEYLDERGKSHFGGWFNKLSPGVAAKIAHALCKLELGIFSNSKSLGQGLREYKIDTGPGYRVYYAKIGDILLLLLAGGTKKSQQKDIELAKKLLQAYKKSSFH